MEKQVNHYIYLMYAETGPVGQWKLGISKHNPEFRYKQLQTANPNLVKIAAVYKVHSDLGWQIEAGLKRYYKNYKIGGEWIRFEGLNEKTFLEKFQLIENNFLSLKNKTQNI